MSEMLAQFIKYLEENQLLEFDILEESDSCFENRFKIQKYVFLAKRFGFDFPFEHSIYLYGPYSRSLTEQYFHIAENREEMYDTIDSTIPKSFRVHDFLSLIKNKSVDWLEIATTIISRNKLISKRNDLVENVEKIKHDFSKKFISDVLDNLKDAHLVQIAP